MSKLAALALMVALSAAGASGQHRGSMSGITSIGGQRASTPGGRSQSIGISGVTFNHRRGFEKGGHGWYTWPYLYPGYDYADSYDSYQTAPPSPPVPTASAAPAKQEPSPDPVLLELQGNHWVRVSSFQTISEQPAGAAEKAAVSEPMPPAVLVFRDGHSEEVSSYSIIGSVIYAKGDYWASGHWTRTIQIADLNIPQTLKQNHERGVRFELPSGPDEVMIRP